MVDIYAGNDDEEIKRVLEDKAKNQTPPAAGFADRFVSSAKRAFTVDTAYGREKLYDDLAQEQLQILQDNNLMKDLPGAEPEDAGARAIVMFGKSYTRLGVEVTPSDRLSKIISTDKEAYRKLQQENPDLGLRTIEQLQDDQLREFNRLIATNEEHARNSSFGGIFGAIAGSIAGSLRDPLIAATAIVPGGVTFRGASYLVRAAKTGAAEIAAYLATELVNKPGELEIRKKLGEEITIADIVTEVALESLASFFVGGGLGGIAKHPADVKAALLSAKRAEDLLRAKPPAISEEEHLVNLNDALKKVQDGEDIAPPLKGITGEVSPPKPLLPHNITPPAGTKEVEDVVVTQARTTLNDVKYADVFEKETIDMFKEIDADVTAVDSIAKCLLKGAS